jgi:hypothetical protein
MTKDTAAPPFNPHRGFRFGRIPRAKDYSGWSRSRLYREAAKRPGLFRKDGRTTIVDFDRLDEGLDELPPATIKPAG